MDNTKPKKKSETKERRAEVLDFMQRAGPFVIPVKSLAEKWNCSLKTIYNDRDALIKKINFSNVTSEGKKILMSVQKNMSIGEILRNEKDPIIRLKAIKAINDSGETFTKLLENYGFKAKVAELHKFENPVTINFVTHSNEDIKNDKAKNKDNPRDNINKDK